MTVELCKLNGETYGTLASAVATQWFEVDKPLPMSFDPASSDPPLSTRTEALAAGARGE